MPIYCALEPCVEKIHSLFNDFRFNEDGMTKSHDEAAKVCSPKGKLFEPMSSDFSIDNDHTAIIEEYISMP